MAVSRVIDGDTFVSNGGRIREYGIDAPEVGRRCAGEATARLRGIAGDTVRVEPGPRSKDPYGRLLYYVYTESSVSIDETLVRDYLVGLETQASRDGSGCLWLGSSGAAHRPVRRSAQRDWSRVMPIEQKDVALHAVTSHDTGGA